MGYKWDVPPDAVFPQMAAQYTQTVFQSGRRIAHGQAAEMQEFARSNAPWTDRTGRTRAGLNARVEETEGSVTIVLAYAETEPGVFLELANGGRYSIIPQTIDVFGPKLMQELQAMIRGGALAGFGFDGRAGRFRNLSTGRFVSRGDILNRLG